jgi:hypothetical protein
MKVDDWNPRPCWYVFFFILLVIILPLIIIVVAILLFKKKILFVVIALIVAIALAVLFYWWISVVFKDRLLRREYDIQHVVDYWNNKCFESRGTLCRVGPFGAWLEFYVNPNQTTKNYKEGQRVFSYNNI